MSVSISGTVSPDGETGVADAANHSSATDVLAASRSDIPASQTRIFALPEPAAWVLGLVGFAGLGLGAFRKRKPRLESGLD